MSTIVEESVHSLLEHPLLIPNDHLGGFQLQKILETVIPVDNPAVEVVQV